MFRPLAVADASSLAALLATQRSDYLRGFHPFAFDTATIAGLATSARADRYWLIDVDGAPAGLVMLRGFDAGYARPSFGLVVAEDFAGSGIGARALAFALDWCRANAVAEVLLKVAEDNAAALALYRRAGFVPAGRCDTTGHLIYILGLGEA